MPIQESLYGAVGDSTRAVHSKLELRTDSLGQLLLSERIELPTKEQREAVGTPDPFDVALRRHTHDEEWSAIEHLVRALLEPPDESFPCLIDFVVARPRITRIIPVLVRQIASLASMRTARPETLASEHLLPAGHVGGHEAPEELAMVGNLEME